MPDDLLRFVSGPVPYAGWWLWLGLALLLLVIAWFVGVLVWTLPAERLRTIPWIRSVHSKLLRRKFSRAVRSIEQRYRSGQLSAGEAGRQMSRTLRSFLGLATGTHAQYMHVDAIKESGIAAAAPLIAALDDARFNAESPVQISRVGAEAEELIRTWI